MTAPQPEPTPAEPKRVHGQAAPPTEYETYPIAADAASPTWEQPPAQAEQTWTPASVPRRTRGSGKNLERGGSRRSPRSTRVDHSAGLTLVNAVEFAFEAVRAVAIGAVLVAATALWWAILQDAPYELGALLWSIGLGLGLLLAFAVIARNLRRRWVTRKNPDA